MSSIEIINVGIPVEQLALFMRNDDSNPESYSKISGVQPFARLFLRFYYVCVLHAYMPSTLPVLLRGKSDSQWRIDDLPCTADLYTHHDQKDDDAQASNDRSTLLSHPF